MLASVKSAPWRREGVRRSYRSARVLIWLVMLIVIVGAVVAYLETRTPDQGRVSASVLPLPRGAWVESSYTDCSKVNSVTYDSHEPCQTFALVRDPRFATLQALYNAQLSRLREVDWHVSPARLLVDNHTGLDYAPRAASWTAPRHQACAVVLTESQGIAAERKALFPYDPYDIPRGLYRFYRRAQAADSTPTLWEAVIPDADQVGRPVC